MARKLGFLEAEPPRSGSADSSGTWVQYSAFSEIKYGIQTPLPEYARSLVEEGFAIGNVGESDYDDPSLALMYDRLKSMSLQTIKGSSMISGQTEFNFVAQMTRVFCRMGMLPEDIVILPLTVLCRVPRPRSLPGVIVVLRATPTSTAVFDRSWDTY